MSIEQPLAALRRRLTRPEPARDDGAADRARDHAAGARDWTGDWAEDGEADDEADDADPGDDRWAPSAASPQRHWLAAVRADPGRAGGIALAAVAVLAVLVTVFTLIRAQTPPVASAKLPPVEPVAGERPDPAPDPGPPGAEQNHRVVVSVVGLVHQPGLVTLAAGARLADAVAAAGGTLDGADTLGLNLARHVADGEQIVVGIATPAGRPAALASSATGQSPGPAGPAPTGEPDPGPVDLNTAGVGELDELPGVGPVTAAAIVAWRTANGRFTSVDQLAEVDGIGPARLEKLRPLVRV